MLKIHDKEKLLFLSKVFKKLSKFLILFKIDNIRKFYSIFFLRSNSDIITFHIIVILINRIYLNFVRQVI